MKKISEEDLNSLKSLAENAQQDWEYDMIHARSSAYLSIETIHQLKIATRNNLMFTILGGFIGFITSLSVAFYSKSSLEQDLQQLKTQLHELSRQQNDFQKYYSKKDSLQTSSKKN